MFQIRTKVMVAAMESPPITTLMIQMLGAVARLTTFRRCYWPG
jgi:hypothetical protein